MSHQARRQVLQSCLNQFLLRHVCAHDLWRRAWGVRGVSMQNECYHLADVDMAVDPNRDAVIVVVDAHAVFLSVVSKPFE